LSGDVEQAWKILYQNCATLGLKKSAPQAITVTNTSSVALTFTSIRTAGGSANQYTQNNNCGTSLAADAFCTVNVTFAPTSRGLKNATLQVNVATPATSASVTLTGTGH